LGGLIVIGLISASFYWYQGAFAEIGNLNIYTGSVEVIRGQSNIPGSTGLPILLADNIKTTLDSRSSIILKDGSVIRLEAGTEITIAEITYEGQKLKKAVFKLVFGKIWSQVKPLADNGSFAVETPTLVATVRGTSFSLSYLNQISQLYVASHQVFAFLKSDPLREQAVSDGYFLTVNDASAIDDFKKGPRPILDSEKDDWILFNEKEDANNGEIILRPDFLEPTKDKNQEIKENYPKSDFKDVQSTKDDFDNTPSKTISPSLKTLNLITEKKEVYQGELLQLKVAGINQENYSTDQTNNVFWNVNPPYGGVDAKGIFRGGIPGQVTIKALLSGIVSNTIMIEIKSAPNQGPADNNQQASLLPIAEEPRVDKFNKVNAFTETNAP
jgi:hypothetical protein